MTAGGSRAATTITRQPALAPSPQPRPAPTGRALIAQNVGKGGPFWMPIRGPDCMPIDINQSSTGKTDQATQMPPRSEAAFVLPDSGHGMNAPRQPPLV